MLFRSALPLSLACTLLAAPSRAADEQTCVAAYDESQRTRRAGKLIKTRDTLLVCAQESCPAAVSKACTRWLEEVKASLPTVVLGAKDGTGRDIIDVEVFDGATSISDKLDGRAVPLDPGAHELRFVFPDGAEVVERVLLRESEKNRAVTAQLPSPPPAPRQVKGKPEPAETPAPAPTPPSAGPPTVSIVLGAVGVAALASFAYFGITAQRDADDLDESCAPNCPKSDTDAVKDKALIADISLGVGIASLAGATYFWVTAHPASGGSRARITSVGIAGRF